MNRLIQVFNLDLTSTGRTTLQLPLPSLLLCISKSAVCGLLPPIIVGVNSAVNCPSCCCCSVYSSYESRCLEELSSSDIIEPVVQYLKYSLDVCMRPQALQPLCLLRAPSWNTCTVGPRPPAFQLLLEAKVWKLHFRRTNPGHKNQKKREFR